LKKRNKKEKRENGRRGGICNASCNRPTNLLGFKVMREMINER